MNPNPCYGSARVNTVSTREWQAEEKTSFQSLSFEKFTQAQCNHKPSQRGPYFQEFGSDTTTSREV